MTIRTFVSAASAFALLTGAVPAFAAASDTPVPLVMTTGHENLRELYMKALFADTGISRMDRMEALNDLTGRSLLARSQIRFSQRNFRRHVLGYLRGLDYRVLNVTGDARKRGLFVHDNMLPGSLVVTGAGDDSNGHWGFDRPTRRDAEQSNVDAHLPN